MASASTVGKSERTPLKHKLFNKTLGQVTGVATSEQFKSKRLVILDLCAGEAAVTAGQEWSEHCSPGITAKHAKWAADKGKLVVVHEHEKAAATFGTLQDNLALKLPTLGYTTATGYRDWYNYVSPDRRGGVQYHLECVDSTTKPFTQFGAGDIVFVFNDPNSIHSWAANSAAIEGMLERGALVTSFHTMGCNAGGVRRLKDHQRAAWSIYVDDVVAQCETTGQVCALVSLDRDAHRWGYLITWPQKWRERLVRHIESSANEWAKGVTFAFADEQRFDDIKAFLLPEVPDCEIGESHD